MLQSKRPQVKTPHSQNVPELVKTSPKNGQNVPMVKNVGQNVPKMIFSISTYICTYGVRAVHQCWESLKKKERVWPDEFQTFFPVQSSFCGGTKSHMVPASIHHIYINCWFPVYRWSVMQIQVTRTPPPPFPGIGGGGGTGYLFIHY